MIDLYFSISQTNDELVYKVTQINTNEKWKELILDDLQFDKKNRSVLVLKNYYEEIKNIIISLSSNARFDVSKEPYFLYIVSTTRLETKNKHEYSMYKINEIYKNNTGNLFIDCSFTGMFINRKSIDTVLNVLLNDKYKQKPNDIKKWGVIAKTFGSKFEEKIQLLIDHEKYLYLSAKSIEKEYKSNILLDEKGNEYDRRKAILYLLRIEDNIIPSFTFNDDEEEYYIETPTNPLDTFNYLFSIKQKDVDTFLKMDN